jgi:hypothetical protein
VLREWRGWLLRHQPRRQMSVARAGAAAMGVLNRIDLLR